MATFSALPTGEFIEGVTAYPQHFTSVMLGDIYSAVVSGYLFDGLVSQAAAGYMTPALAVAMPDISKDGRTYTFRLRKALRWSDGIPITAADVDFTWRLMWSPEYREIRSPRRAELERHLESIVVHDDLTISFTTRQPMAAFVTTHGTYGILPRHRLEPFRISAFNEFDRKPDVVNGVFMLESASDDREVCLVPNPTYHRGKSGLMRYRMRVFPSADAVTCQLLEGHLDIGEIVPSRFEEVAHAGHLTIREFDVPGFMFCALQLNPSRSALFSDVRTRQAFTHAVNRERIAKDVFMGHATVAHSIQPRTSWAFDANVEPRYSYDADRAIELLLAAGWTKSAAGWVNETGEVLRVDLIYNRDNPIQVALAESMCSDLAAIGVPLAHDPRSFTDVMRTWRYERDFSALLVHFGVGADPEVSNLWASRNTVPGCFNGSGFCSDEVDALLDSAVSTHDRTLRLERYGRLQRLMAELCPGIFLVYPKSLWGIHRRVKGVDIGPFNRYSVRPWMHSVSVGQ